MKGVTSQNVPVTLNKVDIQSRSTIISGCFQYCIVNSLEAGALEAVKIM